MSRTITELGPREAEFLATVAAEGSSIFSLDRARRFWGSDQYTRNVLSGLERKGWLHRLERGSYLLVPLEAGVERMWSADPIAVGSFLVPDGGAAYWTAMRYRGWTTQLPQEYLFISPRRRSKTRATILGVRYRFVTVQPTRLFGITEEAHGDLVFRVTDPERTVVDMLDRTDLSGGVPEIAEALARAWAGLDLDRLASYVTRFGSGTVPKRLGFLAEELRLPGVEGWLERWRSLRGAGFTRLERGGGAAGRFSRRWGLRVNAGGFDAKDGA